MTASSDPQPGNDNHRRRARAYWTVRPGHGAIRGQILPAPGPGELLIRASYGAISRGTETLVHRGHVPERLHNRMRCPFQEGHFPGPVKYGYSIVGTVVDGPADWLNRPVFCLHPHQDLFTVPEEVARPLPADLPPDRAILAANMETALNALWDAKPRKRDRICVIGAGVIGLLTAYLVHRRTSRRVTVIDVKPEKAQVAARLGLEFTGDSGDAEYSLIFHASGHPGGLGQALRMAAFEGRIIDLSWYGNRPVTLQLGEDFHDRRLTLQSSQVGSVAPSRRGRCTPALRLDKALELLRDDRLDALITGETMFDDLPATMAALANGALPALCRRIVYP